LSKCYGELVQPRSRDGGLRFGHGENRCQSREKLINKYEFKALAGLIKMEETWKNVNYKNFGNLYQVSTKGEVRRTKTGKILKIYPRAGYSSLSMCNIKQETVNIHRIVALTFLENPDNLQTVNHKNGDKTDNNVSNLEWCSYKSNTEHALKTNLVKTHKKKVEKYSYDGSTLIETFDSIKDAESKTGVGNRLISQVCRGQKPTAHGFRWKYADGFDKLEKNEIEGEVVMDFPNYLITQEGKIYSIRSKRYLAINQTGEYCCIKLCNNGIQKDAYIHLLVADAFIPKLQKYTTVKHLNLDKKDNRKENLEWI
jgi:hypothetical protein